MNQTTFTAMTRRWTALVVIILTVVLARQAYAAGDCPQPRLTGAAPEWFSQLVNPLAGVRDDMSAGQRIFQGQPGTFACAHCHGKKGAGDGDLATQFEPPPRNFACAQTVAGIPDGQLFWIIRFGSDGTAMPSHPELSDEQIWQVLLYVRQLAK